MTAHSTMPILPTEHDDPALAASIQRLGTVLRERALLCVTAESCTGGLLGAALTRFPGASDWFAGGIIAYSNTVKMALLGVTEPDLARYGAVSETVVHQMARGACATLGAQVGISVSGIAGPGGGNPEKPVGTVYIGLAINEITVAFHHHFSGNRDAIRLATIHAAVQHTLKALLS